MEYGRDLFNALMGVFLTSLQAFCGLMLFIAAYTGKRQLDLADTTDQSPEARSLLTKQKRLASEWLWLTSAAAVAPMFLVALAVGELGANAALLSLKLGRLALASWEWARIAAPFLLPFVGVCVGLVLFRLRSSRRVAYGVLELVVAVTTLALIGKSAPDGQTISSGSIAFAGAVYVLIRGLTNISDGLPESHRRMFDRLIQGHRPN